MKVRTPILAVLAALILGTGCSAGDGPDQGLSPPDFQGEGTSGFCEEPTGGLAEVTLELEAPSPPCVIVSGTQQLKVINRLPREVTVFVGEKGLEVGASGEAVFPLRFEQYLLEGGHIARSNAYPGEGATFEVRYES